MNRIPLDQLSCATFAKLLNSSFRVHRDDQEPVEIELIEATPYPPGCEDAKARNFSLIFSGPLDRFLSQRTYLLEHGKLGAFDLFIVPIGKDQNAYRYQAIFNR
jgi:hypothetical protein